MSKNPALLRFRVDFSEAALDGQVSVFPGDAVLKSGQQVELFDDEGNSCPGVIESIDKKVAWVDPDLSAMKRPNRITALVGRNPADVLRAMLRTPPSSGQSPISGL